MQGAGCRVQGAGCRDEGFRVWDRELDERLGVPDVRGQVSAKGVRVWGLGCGVWGVRFGVYCLGVGF